MNDLVTSYLSTWNEQDADARAKLLADHWADNASYTDPLAEAAGRDAISATIGAVHEQFPGFVFTPVGDADGHHRQTRFQWGLGPEGAEPVVVGFDVVVTNDQGRIETVLGFLDRVPPTS
ncbi:nuclear transport factor 2 family protein [Luteipulveratus sp. YIM 133132]|uniref:nuclear transport factor 2 family protein n=1 Tax=Luteipulveratus flavus TaxID=3031728 RepID=UPI0023B1EC92|nr:nuclear transport factor 2 family protein [Luteipulveratus sp. YIM 133132]MDE9366894.1 nuclear transport factor 2 family protein [Luteipulveratus sp. YIM 133132]